MTSTTISPVTDLISTCNTLISSLSSPPSEHASQPTIVSIYTTIFDTLDQLFTLYTNNGLPLNDLEAINHIPLDQLISILNQSMQSSETQDFTIENNKKDLGLMLARLSKCAKNYTLFKVIFPSTTALKLMSIFFQIWKVIPNDQLGVDSVINLIGLLFYRNKDLTESFTEAICSFIQELVLDVKPKSPKQHYSFVLELVLTVMKNMTLQGLDFSQDLGNQGYVTQTLIQNLKGVEKFMDKFIEFLLERYENSKHSGFKQLLKISCEGLFQQLTDPSSSMSSKLGFKLLERFCAILKTNYYTMPHKVFYADLILSFFKKNLKSFYNITQTMQYLFIYATNKQVKSANKSSRFCSICAPNEIRKGNESPDGICESCEFLLEHLDLTKNKKNSKHSMFQNFQSIIHLEHLLDFKGLTFTLLQPRTTMHSSQKNNMPSMFSFNSDDVAKYLNESELYDRLVVFLKQVEIDDNMQLSNKMLEDLYILNSIPQFSKVLSNFLELCIILSNENSCTLRLKAIDFLNEMAKSCPEAMLNDENLMTTLKHRMLDVSSHARLNALEVFLYLIRRNFDSKSEAFQLVLSRANDIFPAFRKAVVTFILDTLVVEEETLSNDPALLQQLFEVLARKTCDKEDIAATSFTGLLHIMFPSFKPNSQTLKKLECKLFTGSSKKSSKKSNNGDEEAHFEKNLRLLRSSFESLGQEWYYKMLSEASKIGTIDSNEIVSFIGFLLSKVHKTQENKNFLFSLLKPFSENFPSQFVPELTYFQVYLSEYNKAKLSSEHREERKAVRQVCEILQNVMTYHSESFTASQLKKFSTLEREFLEIVYNDSQMLVSAAMKTLSFSTKKLTRDFQLINQEFFKCYNLFLSHFNIYANSSRNPSMNKSAVIMQDEKSQELPERQDIRQILPSLIRSAYIVAYIIKFLGTEHLSPVLYAINMSEDEMVNGLYAKFSSFIDMQHGVIEMNQAGIECVAALWEYKPLLALKSKDLLRQFLASVPTNEVMKAMQIQTLSVFHSILLEYRQENQRSLQSLDDKFRDYMASAKKNLPPKSPASWERRTSSTTARSAKKPAERSSVVQLISECMSLVVPHVYESDSNVKLLITRVVLLMMQEGHCHVHTVFPKIFALIGDDNEDVRACCLTIVESAMAKNATIVSFELENSLIEAQAFEQKYKTSTVLYVENSEQEKISTYEKVYENSLRHGSDNEMVLRTCLDAVSTLVLTTGNNYNIMQFLCEFVSSLPRIKIDHLLKTLGSLRTHIEKTYHKVIKVLKPIAKSSQKSEENVQDKEESQSPEVSQGLSEAENNQNVVEKHKNTIFSLFISLVYTNLLTKITKETSNGKKISGNLNEDSISTCIEHIQRKLTTEVDKNSFAKIEFNYDTLTAVRTALRQYFELNYHMDQNVKDLYKTIKGLYKGKTECMELFESIGIVSANEEEVNNKKSMSKKKKVVQKTVHETPKKGKIKVVIKRNTTAAKKNRKTDIDDDDTARKEWEEYEPAFTKEVVFNTEYKTKLRKKKRNQFGDPLQEIY